jgi:hypothetical protein
LSKQKYGALFPPNRRWKPGPKGPRTELIRAVVEMEQRNPNWGCPRIAQQIALMLHLQIDKDVVRMILPRHDGARTAPRRSFLADVPGRHGSIYSADHWLRRPCWEGRWWSHCVGCLTAPSAPNAGCQGPEVKNCSPVGRHCTDL